MLTKIYNKINHGETLDTSSLNEFADNITNSVYTILNKTVLSNAKLSLTSFLSFKNYKENKTCFYKIIESFKKDSVIVIDDFIYKLRSDIDITHYIFYPSTFYIGYILFETSKFHEYMESLDPETPEYNIFKEQTFSKDIFITNSPFFDSFNYTFDNYIYYINSVLSKPTFKMYQYKLVPAVYDVSNDYGYVIIDNILIQLFNKHSKVNLFNSPDIFRINIFSHFIDMQNICNYFIPSWSVSFNIDETKKEDVEKFIYYFQMLFNSFLSSKINNSNFYYMFLFNKSLENKEKINFKYEFENFSKMQFIKDFLSSYFLNSEKINVNKILSLTYFDVVKTIISKIIQKFINSFFSTLDESFLSHIALFLPSIDDNFLLQLPYNEVFFTLKTIQIQNNYDIKAINDQIQTILLSNPIFQDSIEKLLLELSNLKLNIEDDLKDLNFNTSNKNQIISKIKYSLPFLSMFENLDDETIKLQIIQIQLQNLYSSTLFDEISNMHSYFSSFAIPSTKQTFKKQSKTNNIIIECNMSSMSLNKQLSQQFYFVTINEKIRLNNTHVYNETNLQSYINSCKISDLLYLLSTLNIKQFSFMNISVKPNITQQKMRYKLVDCKIFSSNQKSSIYVYKTITQNDLNYHSLTNLINLISTQKNLFQTRLQILVQLLYLNSSNILQIKDLQSNIFVDNNNNQFTVILNNNNIIIIDKNTSTILAKYSYSDIYKHINKGNTYLIKYNNNVYSILFNNIDEMYLEAHNYVLIINKNNNFMIFEKVQTIQNKQPAISVQFNLKHFSSKNNYVSSSSLNTLSQTLIDNKEILNNLCIKDLQNSMNTIFNKLNIPISSDLMQKILDNQINLPQQLLSNISNLINNNLFSQFDILTTCTFQKQLNNIDFQNIYNHLQQIYPQDEIINALVKYTSLLDKIIRIQNELKVDIGQLNTSDLISIINSSISCL